MGRWEKAKYNHKNSFTTWMISKHLRPSSNALRMKQISFSAPFSVFPCNMSTAKLRIFFVRWEVRCELLGMQMLKRKFRSKNAITTTANCLSKREEKFWEVRKLGMKKRFEADHLVVTLSYYYGLRTYTFYRKKLRITQIEDYDLL